MQTKDIEINIENEEIIPKFIEDINFVHAGLRVVQTNNEKIGKLKEQQATATLIDKEKRLFITYEPLYNKYIEISSSLNELLSDSNNILERVKQRLEQMKSEVDNSNKDEPVRI